MNIRSLLAVLGDRTFTLMWIAMFISSSGSALMLIALSVMLFQQTGLALAASSVFAAQWGLPIVLAPLSAYLCRRVAPRTLLARLEILSVLISLLIGFFFSRWVLMVFLFLFIRGFCESVVKSARMVALKHYISASLLEKANSLFDTSYYIGAGAGALAATLLVDSIPFMAVAALDAGTFALSAACYGLIAAGRNWEPAAKKASRGVWRKSWVTLRDNVVLRKNFFYLLLTTALFQGYHTVARTVVPMEHLHLDAAGVSFLQFLCIGAVVCGAVFVSLFMTGEGKKYLPAPVFVGVAAILMTAAWKATHPAACMGIYFFFIFTFEISYTLFNNGLMVSCHKNDIAHISVIKYIALLGGMTLTTVVSGRLSDIFGLMPVSFGLACLALALALFIEFAHRRRPLPVVSIRGAGGKIEN